MNKLTIATLTLGGCLALASLQSANAAEIIDLGDFTANAINDVGQIAGALPYPGITQAAVWQNGIATWLPAGTAPYDIPIWGAAYGINNVGQVVGIEDVGPGSDSPFFWQNGELIDPGAGGFYYYYALPRGINDSGTVVGGDFGAGSQAAIFQNGAWSELLPEYGIFGSQASAINNAGQVVGVIAAAFAYLHPFVWQNGIAIDLGLIAYRSEASERVDINNAGKIVGTAIFPGQSTEHAFLWQDGNAVDLGTLGPFNYFPSRANAINDSDQIVGNSTIQFFPTSPDLTHAFIWSGGAMTDLNDLLPPDSGWVLTNARDINNLGQIIGTGIHDGQTRDFLLTVPEPSSLVLASLSLVGLVPFLWRRARSRSVLVETS